MKSNKKNLRKIIVGMRNAYESGENAMAWARRNSDFNENSVISTLIAYDLQAGTYAEAARFNPEYTNNWCNQLAKILEPFILPSDNILEVGVGEATTLAGVLKAIGRQDISAFGFDISWSRLMEGKKWCQFNSVNPTLFSADLFSIPLADDSMDIVYTSHSLEPNGGREKEALMELLRVARKAVVLVEPGYELAQVDAQQRMMEHGYVRGLQATAAALGVSVTDSRLLPICNNPLNPSAVTILTKPIIAPKQIGSVWQCPLTDAPLAQKTDYFYANQVGVAYPVLQDIPMLSAEHAIIASKLAIDS
jgi:SAM-dependent methyltransferase